MRSFRTARALDPSASYNVTGLAWAWALAGERDSALAVREELPERGEVLKEIAIVHSTSDGERRTRVGADSRVRGRQVLLHSASLPARTSSISPASRSLRSTR